MTIERCIELMENTRDQVSSREAFNETDKIVNDETVNMCNTIIRELQQKTFVFQLHIVMNPEEMEEARRVLLRQREEGLILLPPYIDAVYPGIECQREKEETDEETEETTKAST